MKPRQVAITALLLVLLAVLVGLYRPGYAGYLIRDSPIARYFRGLPPSSAAQVELKFDPLKLRSEVEQLQAKLKDALDREKEIVRLQAENEQLKKQLTDMSKLVEANAGLVKANEKLTKWVTATVAPPTAVGGNGSGRYTTSFVYADVPRKDQTPQRK